MSADKLYAEAKDALDGGQYDLAIKRYEALEARFPYGRYSQRGSSDRVRVPKQADQTSAVAAAERFIMSSTPTIPTSITPTTSRAWRISTRTWVSRRDLPPGRTERDPKSARESFDAFKDLAQRYPESKYTPDALARMKYLINALAAHELHVARWYVRRGAYVAAANRAQYALKNYPEAPVQEEALLVMIQCYDALGITDLRNDAERIVRKNFPNSEQAKSVLSQLGR
jgi:outer membrane protein assembly factor BamD